MVHTLHRADGTKSLGRKLGTFMCRDGLPRVETDQHGYTQAKSYTNGMIWMYSRYDMYRRTKLVVNTLHCIETDQVGGAHAALCRWDEVAQEEK